MKVRITDKRPDMDEMLIEAIDDKGVTINITIAAVASETENETSVMVEVARGSGQTSLLDEPSLSSYNPDEVGGTKEYVIS